MLSIFLPLKTLYSESSRLTVMGSCLDRIEGVFDEKTLPDNGKKHIPVTSSAPEISFENVTFAYGEEDTMRGVSFTAEKNTMTALVGPSGGGKTTLANLLARFWDIKSGRIKVRGVDIRDVPLSELMDKISMVFQRVYLFQDTVYNNIAMGRPTATREEVEEVIAEGTRHMGVKYFWTRRRRASISTTNGTFRRRSPNLSAETIRTPMRSFWRTCSSANASRRDFR